ncbi:MAG: MotA/TolQ/ExbB proton channel family protein [Phycisphaerales bacterium]|nr:MotA/TolQ/ExbB proton channel family protein [Phycisphaerales bacterium]
MIDSVLVLAAAPAPASRSLQSLCLESFDAFTVVLILGSVVAGAVLGRCAMEIREAKVLPRESERVMREHLTRGELVRLDEFVRRDEAFVSIVVRAASDALRRGADERGARDSAELVASEQAANWFRKLEPLNIVGNLGPLLGLAGTVWGMILAFSALSSTGGQASPVLLSAGIAKALFHTLLGLLLAVPALTVFGFYRQRVDRLCTRAMIVSAELVDLLLAQHATREVGSDRGRDVPGVPPMADVVVQAGGRSA